MLKIKHKEKFILNDSKPISYSGESGKIVTKNNTNNSYDYFISDNFYFTLGHQNITYNEEYVIYHYTIPQYNKLNYYEIAIQLIFSNFIIKKSKNKNISGKKIIVCIFTLDNDKPIWYPINVNDEHCVQLLKIYLYDKYSKINIQICEACELLCCSHKNEKLCKFMEILSKLSKRGYPKYIEDIIITLNQNIQTALRKSNIKNKRKRKKYVFDIGKFIGKLADELEYGLQNAIIEFFK